MSDFYTFWEQFLQSFWGFKVFGFLHLQALLQVIFAVWILSIIFLFVFAFVERR